MDLEQLKKQTKAEILRIYNNFKNNVGFIHIGYKHDAKEICLGYVKLIDDFDTEEKVNKALDTCKQYIDSARSLCNMPPEVYN